MLRAIDIANFFIETSLYSDEDCMTNLRINKLLYFAQGWNLARNDKPIFCDEIEAWKLGPVVNDVYKAFAPCGKFPISSTYGDYDSSLFTQQDKELLLDVALYYRRLSTSGLIDEAHAKGSPWNQIFDGSPHQIIDQKTIRDYFKKNKPLPTFSINPKPDEFIGHRDKDGILVLPKDWDDDAS